MDGFSDGPLDSASADFGETALRFAARYALKSSQELEVSESSGCELRVESEAGAGLGAERYDCSLELDARGRLPRVFWSEPDWPNVSADEGEDGFEGVLLSCFQWNRTPRPSLEPPALDPIDAALRSRGVTGDGGPLAPQLAADLSRFLA